MKKAVAFLLACSLMAAAFSGCGKSKDKDTSEEIGQASNATEVGTFPIVKEKIELKIMVPIQAGHSTAFTDLDMFKEYEKKTNIHVNWEEVSAEAYAEKYKLVLASNNLPDAFGSGYSADSSVVYKYGQEGIIIPLEKIIDEVGVNTKKYINEREDFRKLSTYPDGHIYALPAIDENQNIRVDRILWTNKTFLDKLGIEQPKTLDEYEAYLRQTTTRDLNGDGKNEYGLTFTSDQIHLTYLFGAFGVSWDGGNYMNQTMDGKGPLKFAPSMEGTRAALEYFHQWYKDGLIDPEIFTQNGQQMKSKSKTEGVAGGLVFWYLDLNDGDETQNEYRVTNMLQNKEGNATWRRNGAIPGYSPNQFYITKANKYPYETIRYIDYWMDNSENALINRFGPQGYSWDYLDEKTESGKDKWTELANIPSGEPRTMENSTLKCPWAFGIPYWCFGDFWSEKKLTAPTALERQGALNEKDSYMEHATVGLPTLTYDEAENKEALTIKTDLFKYVDSQMAKFLTEGVTDESWKTYQDKLKALKAERWTELYNKYYEIYNK